MNEKKKDSFDFWYAVNNTDIRLMPSRHLETFGTTVLNYHMVSELMDSVDQVRVRTGRMLASKPEIITPQAYAQTLLEGFSDEAAKYIDWLKEHEQEVRILQYGYKLKQESFSEQIISDNVKTVADRVEKDVKESRDPLSAVLVGVDAPWDVCLVKLFWEVIRKSAGTNIQELTRRHMFDDIGGKPRAVRDEIDDAFRAANENPSLINRLAAKLQRYNLFEEYEDRFFSLVRSKRK